MALDMCESLRQFNQRTGTSFSMRVGINTGRVVGGMIGTHKFIFDLWGDAVTVASRMEFPSPAASISRRRAGGSSGSVTTSRSGGSSPSRGKARCGRTSWSVRKLLDRTSRRPESRLVHQGI
jgi:hypothetical protein